MWACIFFFLFSNLVCIWILCYYCLGVVFCLPFWFLSVSFFPLLCPLSSCIPIVSSLSSFSSPPRGRRWSKHLSQTVLEKTNVRCPPLDHPPNHIEPFLYLSYLSIIDAATGWQFNFHFVTSKHGRYFKHGDKKRNWSWRESLLLSVLFRDGFVIFVFIF